MATRIREALEHTIGKLSDSQSLLRAVLDNTNNGIFLVGTDLEVLYANRRIKDFFGVDPREAVGRDKREFVTKVVMQQVESPTAFVERLLYLYDHLDETSIDDVEVVRPVPRYLERYSAPVYKENGSMLGRIEVYSDVTETRRLRRDKDEFLAVVSHELRTPVTSIKGYAQLLQRRAKRQEPAEQLLQAYSSIERQATRMQELIDTLLDLSRLDADRLSLNCVSMDIVHLVRHAVDTAQVTTEDHIVTLHAEEPVLETFGDERRLEQVFANLLANAVRYSPDGGPITVDIRRSDDEVVVAVADSGIGVVPDAQTRIFERFYRAPQVPQSTGLGIGLYLSQAIVQRHGGTISVESKPGEGSVFTVRLPVRGPAPPLTLSAKH